MSRRIDLLFITHAQLPINHKLSILGDKPKKEVFFTFLLATLCSRLFEGECRGHFGFCFQNLLVSNVYSWFTNLLKNKPYDRQHV